MNVVLHPLNSESLVMKGHVGNAPGCLHGGPAEQAKSSQAIVEDDMDNTIFAATLACFDEATDVPGVF